MRNLIHDFLLLAQAVALQMLRITGSQFYGVGGASAGELAW